MEVYLDYAATGRRKPQVVFEAIAEFFQEINCNPGRGGYRLSLDAARRVMEARSSLARFFNVARPHQVIFTANVTMALNTAIKGLLQPGEHVLVTGLEHNAVMRPLHALQKDRNISFSVLPTDPAGEIDLTAAEGLIIPRTRMIIATHASNVMGTLVPVKALGRLARKYQLDFIVDTAQTAGSIPLDFSALGATVLAFTGHKHLLGPMGSGGFCVQEEAAQRMAPLYEGGTGSQSDQEEQPEFLPDRFESGTPNVPGIVGLGAAIQYLQEIGVEQIRRREEELTAQLLTGLAEIPGIRVYGTGDARRQTGTVALNMAGIDNAALAYRLDQEYGIMTRPGLHCSPMTHRTMGTFPAGALRISVGHFTTVAEIDYCLESLAAIGATI